MPLSTPIRVRLFAQDVDDLPINFTRADIHLAFRDRTLPMQWRGRGSNEYVADVPTELTAQPGLYNLVVAASDAWDEIAGQITCELLRRNVRIVSGVDIQYIVLGVLAGLAILALGVLLVYQIRSHQDEAKRFVESFFKHEGQLAFKICWDAWVRPSPHSVPRVLPYDMCLITADACRTSAETVRRPSLDLLAPLFGVRALASWPVLCSLWLCQPL